MISVIVPVYNAEKYLKKCLDSLVNQSYKDLEIILVNDGSQDGSEKICKDYEEKDSRIILINKNNGGPSSARNSGIEKANGEYLSFIDSDDYLALDFYEKLEKSITKNNADIAFCKYALCYGEKIIKVNETGLNKFVIDKDIKYFFSSKNHINAYLCRGLFKAKLFENNRYDENIRYCEDLDLILRIINTNNPRFSIVDEYLYFYEQTPCSITRRMDKEKIFRYEKGILKCADLLCSVDMNRYACSLKYNCFIQANNYYVYNKDADLLSTFDKKYNTEENYKAYKSLNTSLKNKIVAFLARHKIMWIYKLLKKIQDS